MGVLKRLVTVCVVLVGSDVGSHVEVIVSIMMGSTTGGLRAIGGVDSRMGMGFNVSGGTDVRGGLGQRGRVGRGIGGTRPRLATGGGGRAENRSRCGCGRGGRRPSRGEDACVLGTHGGCLHSTGEDSRQM